MSVAGLNAHARIQSSLASTRLLSYACRARQHDACACWVLAGGWHTFKGVVGGKYNLMKTGDGTRLKCTFGAGGEKGKGTYVRTVTFLRGRARVEIFMTRRGKTWLMHGERLPACLPSTKPPPWVGGLACTCICCVVKCTAWPCMIPRMSTTQRWQLPTCDAPWVRSEGWRAHHGGQQAQEAVRPGHSQGKLC